MIQTRSVLLGERDYSRLQAVLKKSDPTTVRLLRNELDAATVIPDADLAPDVVVMGSVVTFRDVLSSEESTVTLVYPPLADASRGCISVLAPVGAALIGLRVGESISWPVPKGGERHLEVVALNNPDGDEP
ncbi:MAG: nucleoside diphosphate kinase regulator [Pseudomonadales bacterium]|nr:nucleoside diphosphate kinase regulator [Pseudomonadales bacterium]